MSNDTQVITIKSERDRIAPALRPYYDATLGFRNYWYPATFERELGDEPMKVTMLGENILIKRIDAKVYAIEDACAHRLVPLSKKIECHSKNTITCWYHGWTFDWRDGTIATIITEPDSALIGKPGVKTYPVEVFKGLVFVYIGDGEPCKLSDNLPPGFVEPDRVAHGIRRVVNSNWRWGVENGFDGSHIYIHRDAKVLRMTEAKIPLGLVPTDKMNVTYYTDSAPIGIRERMAENYTPVFSCKVEDTVVAARSNPAGTPAREGPPPVSAASVWMPGVLQIETALIPHQNQYEFYVPIDEKHHMYFQLLGKTCANEAEAADHIRMVDEVWTDLQLHGFNDDDVWAREAIEEAYTNGDGWTRERLFKPDMATMEWRKLAAKHNRGIQRRTAK